MEGLDSLIEVAKAVAGAFAWIVGLITAGITTAVVGAAYLAKYLHEQVVAEKDSRIAGLKDQMSTTLIEFRKNEKRELEKALKILQDAKEKAEADRLAWQKKYQHREKQLVALYEKLKELDPTTPLKYESISEPESDITVISLAINSLENLQEERDHWLEEYESWREDGLASMAEDAAAESMRER